MRVPFLLITCAALAGDATCALDDCSLPASAHALSQDVIAPASAGWMLHDLALARDAARRRDSTRAARLADELHQVVLARAERVQTEEESRFLQAMHADLSAILTAAGWPAPQAPVMPYMDQALTRL